MKSDELKFHVYVHTSPDGKRYIGQTCCKPEYRWGKGGSYYAGNAHFYRAIQKYGWDNFLHEVVASGLTQLEADDLEIELISKYNTTDPNFGYNHESGGRRGPLVNEATKKKISESMKGHKMPDHVKRAARSRMIGNTLFSGKHHTPESKAKIGAAQRGKTTLSKPVVCIETGEVFVSAKFAAESLGDIKCRSAISACCNGDQRTSHGYHWKYINTYVPEEDRERLLKFRKKFYKTE